MLSLLSMLSLTVTKLTRDDCKTHQELLLELFLTCLDYGVQQTKVIIFADIVPLMM